jgi:hypothetical protein
MKPLSKRRSTFGDSNRPFSPSYASMLALVCADATPLTSSAEQLVVRGVRFSSFQKLVICIDTTHQHPAILPLSAATNFLRNIRLSSAVRASRFKALLRECGKKSH